MAGRSTPRPTRCPSCTELGYHAQDCQLKEMFPVSVSMTVDKEFTMAWMDDGTQVVNRAEPPVMFKSDELMMFMTGRNASMSDGQLEWVLTAEEKEKGILSCPGSVVACNEFQKACRERSKRAAEAAATAQGPRHGVTEQEEEQGFVQPTRTPFGGPGFSTPLYRGSHRGRGRGRLSWITHRRGNHGQEQQGMFDVSVPPPPMTPFTGVGYAGQQQASPAKTPSVDGSANDSVMLAKAATQKSIAKNLETFDGSTDKNKFPHWLNQMDRLWANVDQDNVIMIEQVLNKVTGNAFECVANLSRVETPWLEIRAELIKFFDPLGGYEGALEAWTGLKQEPNQDIVDHNMKVLRIAREVGFNLEEVNVAQNMTYVKSLKVDALRRKYHTWCKSSSLHDIMASAHQSELADKFSRNSAVPSAAAVAAPATVCVGETSQAEVTPTNNLMDKEALQTDKVVKLDAQSMSQCRTIWRTAERRTAPSVCIVVLRSRREP